MTLSPTTSCTAFAGTQRVAAGPLEAVARTLARLPAADTPLLVFDDATGRQIELDLRGTEDDVLRRLAASHAAADASGAAAVSSAAPQAAAAPRAPGRPRLGVVAREVTLLPRHWDWLALQPGGASVALRRLVEDARRVHAGKDLARAAQEVCYRFLQALAGELPGYEEALRALFAGDAAGFTARIADWPADVAAYAQQLASAAWHAPEPVAG